LLIGFPAAVKEPSVVFKAQLKLLLDSVHWCEDSFAEDCCYYSCREVGQGMVLVVCLLPPKHSLEELIRCEVYRMSRSFVADMRFDQLFVLKEVGGEGDLLTSTRHHRVKTSK
jgi:hypothetical protein